MNPHPQTEITNTRFDLEAGEVSLRNIWRRHISITMFFRRAAAGDLRFNTGLGIGAGTKWGAGEDTDFLLRFMAKGHTVFYYPSIVVCHPDWGQGPFTEAYYRKAHSYAMGMGRLLRVNRFPPDIALNYLLRPAGGVMWALLQGNPKLAGYYRAVLAGRITGWREAERTSEAPAHQKLDRQNKSSFFELAGAQCRLTLWRSSLPQINSPD